MSYRQFPGKEFYGLVKIQGKWLADKAYRSLPYPTPEEIEFQKNLVEFSMPSQNAIDDDQAVLQFCVSYSRKLIGRDRRNIIDVSSFTEEELHLTNSFFASFQPEEIQLSSGESHMVTCMKYSNRFFGRNSAFYNQESCERFIQACTLLSRYCDVPVKDIDSIANYFRKIVETFVEKQQGRPRCFLADFMLQLSSSPSLSGPCTIWYIA